MVKSENLLGVYVSTAIVVIYHSGYGHTAKVAEAVSMGASEVHGAQVTLLNLDTLDDAGWSVLDEADAIIFGAPTYMGGVSASFKTFMDATSKRWLKQAWKDKVAAGFTNASTLGGDNLSSLYQLMVFAMQHSMIWVGTGVMKRGDINRAGAMVGLMTQSENDSPEVTPPKEDLETARLFGVRVAEATTRTIRR
jgi:NAD(P)H dehydrogenase (quinone)